MTSMARVRTSSSVVLLFLAVGCSRAPGPAPGEGVPREASASVAATEGAVDDPGAPARGELQWFRGNLHAHTNLCDHATSSPADVAAPPPPNLCPNAPCARSPRSSTASTTNFSSTTR